MLKDFKENSVKDMMTAVRRNTQPSACIDNYEKLLMEIKNKEVVQTAVADMNRFIQEMMLMFSDIDKMENKNFKARMLTDDFISPERFFRNSLWFANEYADLNAALNYSFTDNDYRTVKKFEVHNNNKLGKVKSKQYFDSTPDFTVSLAEDEVYHHPDYYKEIENKVKDILNKFNITEYSDEAREECRKVILLWNYMPSIVKAIIQTKKRALDLDKNPDAKRFV